MVEEDRLSEVELLTAATSDAEIARQLAETARSLAGDESRKAIAWEAMRRRAQRAGVIRRIIGIVTYPGAVSGRAWPVLLAVLMAASAVALALIVRDTLELPGSDPVFRGSVFLAVACLGLAVLSGIALTTGRPGERLRLPHEAPGWIPVVVVALRTGMVAAAAAAVVIVALPRLLPEGLGTGLALTYFQATISSTDPAMLKLDPARWRSLTVQASEANAELVVRLVDANGKEIKRESATGKVSVVSRRLAKAERQAVKGIEVLSDRETTVAISTARP